MGKKEIDHFMDSMKLDAPVSAEELKAIAKGAYMDRAKQVYFIWKKIKELYPEVDANRIIREGSWDFGLHQGNEVAKKYGGGENVGPAEALLGQTSKAGMLVFEQEIVELSEDRAVKHFGACPHCEALQELGATKAEIKDFCRDMIGACDYAIVHPFKQAEIDFPTTVADGEGEPCRMTITRPKTPKE